MSERRSTAREQEQQIDCALRALNACDGMVATHAESGSCLCHCASRDLCAAVGWEGAARSHEQARLDALGKVTGLQRPRLTSDS